MAETDGLGNFDFTKVQKPSVFLKFEAGKALKLRVLTIDPIITTQEFESADGEVNLSTRFAFIVYNWTDKRAQILQASPNMAKRFAELHTDEDYGANIRKVDIKITPTGEKLQRKYDIQVLPTAQEMSNDQIRECQEIKLEEIIKDGQRASFYEPPEKTATSGYDAAKAKRNELSGDTDPGDDPINLDDIPF
jgi:hypothetical protein